MPEENADKLTIAGRPFNSRLLIGTGKFANAAVLRACIAASGCEIVTVALRRVDLSAPNDPLLNAVDPARQLLLPNTSGARDAEEAVRLAQLACQMAGHTWVKLEVTPDPATLLPDPIETLKAAKQLVKDGFTVLPYINADPVLARRLEEAGCATIMPLGSPIGSNRGLRTADQVQIIIDQANVPVIVDAGLGRPSDACAAMELGADAVLVNTALATAGDPVAMGRAFAKAVQAGHEGFLAGAGRVLPTGAAEASSPLTGFLGKNNPSS
ncbi:MAG: thiazole synthase [Kiritimatiellae bacterium]|nr:thiazole synthase [Kiritimatiellia bacterium]